MKNFIYRNFESLDYKYISKGLYYLSISQIVGIIAASVSAYFFANYIEKDVYGTYQFVFTILGVMSIFTLRGVGKQIVQSYTKDGELTLIPKTIQFIKFAVPVASIGLAVGGYFYYRENPELALSLVIISVLFPLITGLPLYNSILLAKHQFKQQAILNSIQATIPAIALVWVILNGGGLLQLIAVFTISQALTLVAIFLYTGIKEKAFNTSVELKKSNAEYHLSLGESILEVGKIVDRLTVFSVLGATNFAVYMIALLPVREINRLPMMIKSLVLPKFAQYDFLSVKAKAIEKTFILFFILSTISILYVLTAPYIYDLIFPLYAESVIYTQVLVLFLPFSSTVILSQALTVFDKTRELYTVNIVYSISAVILTYSLAIFFGIWGVIFAKIISLIIRFLGLFYVFIRSS